MVWKERGKYSVGRTLRVDPDVNSLSSSAVSSHFWLDVSVRNGGSMTAKEVIENSHFEDVLGAFVQDVDKLDEDLDGSPSVSLPSDDEQRLIGLSLNKKKRWLLPDLLKEQIREESEEKLCDAPAVTLIERGLLDRGLHGKKADCVAVYTTGSSLGKYEKRAKRRYAYLEDLRKESGLNDEVPEICYEVGHMHPLQNNSRSRHLGYQQRLSSKAHGVEGRNKTRSKLQKRQTKKRFIVQDIENDLNEEEYCENFQTNLQTRELDGVVTEEFHTTSAVDIPLKCFLPDKKAPRNKRERNNQQNARLKTKKYGKGDAIIIPETKSSEDKDVKLSSAKEVATAVPERNGPRPCINSRAHIPAFVLFFHIERESIAKGRLLSDYAGSIEFGHTLPEKFSINLLPMMKNLNLDDWDLMARMLFEVPLNPSRDAQCVEIKTTFMLKTGSAPLIAVSKSLYYHLKKECATPISLGDLVGQATSFLSGALSYDDLHTSKSPPDDISLPLAMVHRSCNVKVDVVDFQEAVAELSDKGCTRDCKSCAFQPTLSGMEMNGECGICFSEGANMSFVCLRDCGHWFCDSCWEQHVSVQIGQCQVNVTCPALKCTSSVNDTFILSVAPHMYSSYKQLKNESLVTASSEHHFCPGKDCRQVAVVRKATKLKSVVPVSCTCTEVWCTECRELAHWPVDCDLASAFRAKLNTFGMNLSEKFGIPVQRIESVQVKNCPKCKYPIEKHRGCPHMRCKCGHEFCWECLTDYHGHDYDMCASRIKQEETVKLPIFQGSKSMEQYAEVVLFYHNRWAKKGTMKKPYRQLNRLCKGSTFRLKGVQCMKCSTSPACVYQSSRCTVKNLEDILHRGLAFKYQAFFVLENLAVVLSMYPRRHKKRTKHSFDTLEFILKIVDQIMRKQKHLQLPDPCLSGHLERMITAGEALLRTLQRCT